MNECEHTKLLELWSGEIKSGYRVYECSDCGRVVVTYQSLFDGVEYDVSKAVNERDALRAELDAVKAVLEDILTCAGYHSGAGGWVVSESLMDEIADVLGNNEASES